MGLTIKDWFFSGNVVYTGSLSQAVQYQRLFWDLKEWFKTSSWTIEMSAGKNGGGTHVGSLGDVILQPDDVSIGLNNAVQSASYFVASPPSGWLSSGPDTQIKVLFITNESLFESNPQEVATYITKGNYNLHSTPATNRPRGDTFPDVTGSVMTLRPLTTTSSIISHRWRTADGDVLFTTSISGAFQTRGIFWVTSITGSSNGEGMYRFGIYCGSDVGQMSTDNLKSSGKWFGYDPAGRAVTVATIIVAASIMSYPNAWVTGVDGFNGMYRASPYELIVDDVSQARYVGRLADVFAKGATTSAKEHWSFMLPGDSGTMVHAAIDGSWVPVLSASLPLLG